MKIRSLLISGLASLTVAILVDRSFAAELPKKITSAACKTAPTVDGKFAPGEWDAAKSYDFDMPMLKFQTKTISTRPCQLRVMNSANALYVALRVPDKAVNKSFNPFDFDFASLAFCRGTEVAAGDDRKVIAVGLYSDKHVLKPGKDADDQKQDGKGAMQHDAASATYSIEWAVPLTSGDKEDLQAKPGDILPFNIAYADAFQADFRETDVGAIYQGGLDKATNWGTIQLASDVVDDGGAAFRGPDWIGNLVAGSDVPSARQLRVTETTVIPLPGGNVLKALIEYSYRDTKGKPARGLAKLYVPASLEHEQKQLPLLYSAGYELDDNGAAFHVSRGFVVATPRAPEVNPLVRSVNPDVVLLHRARALPFVDDSNVMIAGGSAGGYMTLMLAAETFPLAAITPSVPPINWGYNAAYFLQREKEGRRSDPKAPKTPVFDVIVPIVQQAQKVYGDDPNSEFYDRHSPLDLYPMITCPVSVYWTTADMLVPIDQVGTKWIHPFDPAKFPKDFAFDPARLMTSKSGQRRLTDVLKADDYELFVISEQEIKQNLSSPAKPVELPVSKTKRWTITILDEGPPEPQVGHLKYAIVWSQRNFIDQALEQKIAVDQLTAAKLQKLMDRYAGREWIATDLIHLDDLENEKADVVRGLRTYAKQSREHASRFADLYRGLPMATRVLPDNVVTALTK